MPNFEQLYGLCASARQQGFLDWAANLERQIHMMEILWADELEKMAKKAS